MHNILRSVSGVTKIAAVASAAMMLSVTGGHAEVRGGGGCATITATDYATGESVECGYCSTEIEGWCLGFCDNGDLIDFDGCEL